jgi:uncharacterized protein (TIGR00730 family)
MAKLRNVCINCGSNPGKNPSYVNTARELGTLLASRGIGIVYGGAAVGLMGQVADAALACGGKVVGVLPRSLNERVGHRGLTELHLVDTMHERKAAMMELSDAFVALPGGFGTLEEVFEVLTWTQLGIHVKSCGLLNVDGYYDGLLQFLDHATAELFVKAGHRSNLLQASGASALVEMLERAEPSTEPKWFHA